MKKALKIGGGILAVIIVALLVVPFFIDLNSYKGMITEQARAATGRDLVIEGDISLSLLPIPSVSVEGIKFGNAVNGAAANMAEIEQVKVQVALLPLLSKSVEVKSIELVKPTIILEKLADGSGNWEITPAGGAAPAEAPAPAAEGEAAAGGYNISVDGASISDGTLVYRDLATAAEQRIENLNVDLSMQSLQGPFSATGGVTALGMPLGFSVDVGRLDPAQPMPINLSLRVTDAGAEIGFSGQADLKAAETEDQPILVGKLTGKGDSVAKLISVLSGGEATEGPLAQAFALDGEVSAAKTRADLKNFTASLGEMTARGGVAATMGETTNVELDLAMGRLDLDALLPASSSEAAPAADAAPAEVPADNAAGGFALPVGINAKANVAIEQVVVQGNSIDRVKLVADLADAKLNLTELSAQLPGATAFKLGGTLEAQNGQPAFAGGLDVNSSNLRGLIDAFAKGAVDSVPGDRLRAFALNSRVTFTPTQVALSDLAAKLDATRIGGGLTVALPDGKLRQRMAFGVGLSLDKMNLDGYLPKGGEAAAAAPAAEPAAAEGGNPLKALAPLGDLDANIELRAGALTLNEQQIQKLHVLVGLASGVLTIEDLSVGDLMGGKGTVKGQIVDLKGDPRFDLDFDVTAKDANKLAQMAGAEPAGKLGALTLKGKALGGGDEVSYDVALAMTGIGLDGTAKGGAAGLTGGGIPRVNSTFDIKIGKLAPLLALGGTTDATQMKAADNLGAVSFAGSAQSGTDDLTYDIDLAMSGIGAAGKLSGKIVGISGTPQVDTVLDLRADRPAPLLQLAGLAGPKAQQMGALAAKGTLKGGADDMNLDLGLQAAGANVKIAGNIKAKADPMAFDVALEANHPEFTQLLALADLPSSGAKAGPLALQAKAAGSTAKAALSGLDFRWGDSSLTGAANYDATGAKPMVTANLVGGTVNLVPFMGGGSSSGGEASGGGGTAGSPWSNEPLDLSALKAQDADIDFKAASLIMPDQRIDDLIAKVMIKDGVLTMNTLSGRIYGGGFNLSGTSVDARATPQIVAKMAIDQIQIGEALGGGIAGNQIKGPLSLNLDLTGAGESQAAIVRSLTGKGDLGGTMMIIGKVEQTVGSALLGVLGQKVKQVKGIADSINGVIGSYTGVDNQLSGTFDIAQGVLDTQDFAFRNPKASGTAKGQVDLGAWALNMLVDLFGAEAEAAFMSINLTGPVNSPTPAFSGSGAAGPASGGLVPGLNLPGIGTIPGLGGSEGSGVQLPGGVTIPGLGGSSGETGTTEPGAAAPAGGLINEIPGVGDLLGGAKKQETQAAPEAAPAEAEPGAVAPADVVPAEVAPAEVAPVEATPAEGTPEPEAAPAEAAPAEVAPEPGATPAEAAPAEAAPVEEAPVEAAPAEAAPTEAAPAEATPAEPSAVPEELLPEPGAVLPQ